MSFTRIIALDRYNWELCTRIQLAPEQEAYTPSVLYSLAQAKFENLFPFGIEHKGEMVGMIMYGDFGGICWISRVVIDQAHQRQGIGFAAVTEMIAMLERKISCREIRTSYAKGNLGAAAFFEELGFTKLEEALSDEIVLQYPVRSKHMY